MTLKEPQDLFAQELKEIYSAERQLYRALPKLGKAIPSDRLGVMLERRRERGSQLMEAIDDALEEISTTKARKKNVVVEGLIEDANAHAEEIRDEAMLQVAILGSLQKIEHYCIAAWGTSASLGRLFRQPKVVEAMERALEEGKRFDEELTQLAENEINPAMLGEGEKPENDQEEGSKGGSRGGRRKSAA
jgi:ferritin-like metal-binding protein YciE